MTRAILTDIEGTTTRIAYVRDVLFPYARQKLPEFLHDHADLPEVSAALAQTVSFAPDQAPLETLFGWMDVDAKATPLKSLQGLIWRLGYEAGTLRAHVYPDVAPALRRWHAAGIRLEVYSSGSVEAQRQLFGHSEAGNLIALFSGFHDTTTGPKRDAASYRKIAAAAGVAAAQWLFLSDIEEELDAAGSAGMAVCQVVRPEDATTPSGRHPHAGGFDDISNSIIGASG